MVRYGMTPDGVLRTVTYLPVKKMGVAEDLGTNERGKLADFVFVTGNPPEANHVQKVMKSGWIHTVDDMLAPYRKDE